jgi:hypothetical protein
MYRTGKIGLWWKQAFDVRIKCIISWFADSGFS